MAELSVHQTLKDVVEAHNFGKTTEAERPYKAVLKADPQNSDANHNLGLLEIGLGKTGLAPPLR